MQRFRPQFRMAGAPGGEIRRSGPLLPGFRKRFNMNEIKVKEPNRADRNFRLDPYASRFLSYRSKQYGHS